MSDLELAGDNRPAAYWELDGEIVDVWGAQDPDAIMVIRASALGHCVWELAAHLQGHEPLPYPDVILRAFQEGRDAEPAILGRLFGPEMKWSRVDGAAQAVGELKVGPGRVIRFHPDDVGVSSHEPDTPHLIEAKFLASQSFDDFHKHGAGSKTVARYGYDWQLSAMMLGLKLPAVWLIGEKVRHAQAAGAEAPVEVGNLAMRYVTKPPRSLAEIMRRAKEVYDLATGDDLASSDRPCDRPDQWPCLYRHLRPEPEGGEENHLPEIPEDLRGEAERLLSGYVRFRDLETKAKGDKEKLRDALKALLGDTAGTTGTHTYRLIPSTKKVTDKEGFEAVLKKHEINPLDYISEEPGTPSIEVKVVKKAGRS